MDPAPMTPLDPPPSLAIRRRQAKATRLAAARAIHPPPPPPGAQVLVGDAAALPFPDQVVHLIVTSPPYGLDVLYETAYRDEGSRWAASLGDWLAEAYRVTQEHGRLALNVALDTTRGGFRPTYAQAVAAAERAGWTYRATIVWNEGNVTHSTGRGSVDSAASPHVIAPVETIALFSRGTWKRDRPNQGDLTHDQWLRWTNGLWTFRGESHAWEQHPAPFPPELPNRLIRLLSFPGDVVLDPFCGSGTTVLVAHRLGRRAWGVDLSADYVASTLRRLGEVN